MNNNEITESLDKSETGTNLKETDFEGSPDPVSERRELQLNKRLSKFSEKRNSRIKANKGFFLRDKESVNSDEEEAVMKKGKVKLSTIMMRLLDFKT